MGCLFLYLLYTEAAELLQKLSLDPETKSLEVSEQAKKVFFLFDPFILFEVIVFKRVSGINVGNMFFSTQFAPIDSSDFANGLATPFERTATHVHQDFVDPNMCYVPNGYPSPYYFAPGIFCDNFHICPVLEIVYVLFDVGFSPAGYDGQMNEWGEASEILPVSCANFSFMFM